MPLRSHFILTFPVLCPCATARTYAPDWLGIARSPWHNERYMEKIAILNGSGKQVGKAKAALCRTPDDLAQNFCIHRFRGGLDFYRKQFPSGDFWPIFVFDDLFIYREHCRQGHGSRSCNEIADHYQEQGARLGLLRVGTYPFDGDETENLEDALAWRVRMYSRVGWIALRHHPEEQAIIPLMYLPMVGRQLTSVQRVRLVLVSEVPSAGDELRPSGL
jgi:GNAT superfamily N-acetyltransferase